MDNLKKKYQKRWELTQQLYGESADFHFMNWVNAFTDEGKKARTLYISNLDRSK